MPAMDNETLSKMAADAPDDAVRPAGKLALPMQLANIALMLFIAFEGLAKFISRRAELAADGRPAWGLFLLMLVLGVVCVLPNLTALLGLSRSAGVQTIARAATYNFIALCVAVVVTLATQDRQTLAHGDWLILAPWLLIYALNTLLLRERSAAMMRRTVTVKPPAFYWDFIFPAKLFVACALGAVVIFFLSLGGYAENRNFREHGKVAEVESYAIDNGDPNAVTVTFTTDDGRKEKAILHLDSPVTRGALQGNAHFNIRYIDSDPQQIRTEPGEDVKNVGGGILVALAFLVGAVFSFKRLRYNLQNESFSLF